MANQPKPRLTFVRFALLLLAVWLVVAVVGLNRSSQAQAEIVPPAERKSPSTARHELLDGRSWSLEQHRGKVVVVNYWATWCPPCREETPAFAKVYREMRTKGVEFIGVSLDHAGKEVVETFVADFQVPYPIALGSIDPWLGSNIPLPTTLVYDQQGRLAAHIAGSMEESELRSLLQALLSE